MIEGGEGLEDTGVCVCVCNTCMCKGIWGAWQFKRLKWHSKVEECVCVERKVSRGSIVCCEEGIRGSIVCCVVCCSGPWLWPRSLRARDRSLCPPAGPQDSPVGWPVHGHCSGGEESLRLHNYWRKSNLSVTEQLIKLPYTIFFTTKAGNIFCI